MTRRSTGRVARCTAQACSIKIPGALGPVLLAGLGLSVLGGVLGVAWRWLHTPGYFALCFALSAGFAFVIGGIAQLVRAPARVALGAWAALVLALVQGWPSGLAVAVLLLVASHVLVRSHPFVLASAASAAVALTLTNGAWFAGKLGLDGLPLDLGLPIATGLLHAGSLLCLVFVSGPIQRRVDARFVAAGLYLVVVLVALKPALDWPTGLLRLPSAADLRASVPGSEKKPNVFLLVLDTVRADHMSVYGYGRATTPELARWIAQRPNALVYPQAYSNGTWTVPSHATLFTGLLPDEHGAHFALDGSLRYCFALRPGTTTLAQRMQTGGYATLGTFANNWLRIVGGLDQGFERYFRSHHKEAVPFLGEALRDRLLPGLCSEVAKSGTRADAVNASVLSMVKPWARGERPLYVFANYGDTHGPYAPPSDFRGRFHPTSLDERSGHVTILHDQERRHLLTARYDEELLYLDSELGKLLDALSELELFDDSWVFITSDHGEAFAEHGVTEHGTTVFNEVIRVPLIVFPPKGVELEGTSEPVSLVDVAATIAAIAGHPFDTPVPGIDLRVPYIKRSSSTQFYGDALKARIHGDLAAHAARVLVHGRHKLIEVDGRFELYDLLDDPGEENDLAALQPELVELLGQGLPPWGEPTAAAAGTAGTQAEVEQLRAMGYVGD